MATPDTPKRVPKTHVRKTTLRKALRWMMYLIEHRGADIHDLKIYAGNELVTHGRRLKSDGRRRRETKPGRPARNHGRKPKEEHVKELARERARRYRARQKQKKGKDGPT